MRRVAGFRYFKKLSHGRGSREGGHTQKDLGLHSVRGRRQRHFFSFISARPNARASALNEGEKVSFDLVADRRTGKSNADNLRAL
jgi:hypothetical protein